ncbi:RagB/SusD family nutrient uptake outer membrane protein [Aquimarina addita]|uniref:RagB/SusD family nutrient uptake outer membrane protein n=1 Tax=Aquimarina addita TaxID=870485 RepID=A0ABP6UST6_9FLAO
MKMTQIIKTLSILSIMTLISCSDALEEETFSVLGPTNFYNSAEDAEALLNGVYTASQGYRDISRDYLTINEMTTDILIERGGGINANTQPIEDFIWPTTHPYFDFFWGRYYVAIYRANVTIEQVPNIDMDEERRTQIVAEARFLRAFNYFQLYDLFGPVPLIVTSQTAVTDRPFRSTKEEMLTFMENEFNTVADILPATQEQFGRVTNTAALGFLTKMYLNNRDWQLAADTAQELISLGVHDLFTEGNRTDLFALANEGDNEFIFVAPFPDNPATGLGNTYLSHAAPPGYQFEFPPKVNFAAQFKILSSFIDIFSEEDERLDAFLFEYTNGEGNLVVLGEDDTRSFKYQEDPNGIGDISGNDWPYLRYADILLSRAEALNELQGPNQESIDLINDVRLAAGLMAVSVVEFPSSDSLNDFILEERAKEFHTEGLRRQDLIRHDKFISEAISRGKPAQDFNLLFPIPQSEIDKNQNLMQNDGY